MSWWAKPGRRQEHLSAAGDSDNSILVQFFQHKIGGSPNWICRPLLCTRWVRSIVPDKAVPRIEPGAAGWVAWTLCNAATPVCAILGARSAMPQWASTQHRLDLGPTWWSRCRRCWPPEDRGSSRWSCSASGRRPARWSPSTAAPLLWSRKKSGNN